MYIKILLAFALAFLFIPHSAKAYSVLTHEALVDATWDHSLKPLLKKMYPQTTEQQLKEAHGYAYGGAVSPDMGYYPFGSKLFTNLVHYVRSGDFIQALLDSAQDVNEYAFALGALCHYNADKYGHSLGTNLCVPLVYPKMKSRFGDTVTYAEDHASHIRMEFAFDVLQIARGNYASQAYHDFIGFKVAKPVLEKAFLKTYGLDLNKVFKDLPLAIETFRFCVKDLFPEITKAAWIIKKSQIQKAGPTPARKAFVYRMHRINFNREYGKGYKHPGFFANALSVLIRILPKAGPLKALKFKEPTPQAEKLYIQSFDTVLRNYSEVVKELYRQKVHLSNIDFDTGKKIYPGEYPLVDEGYADLLLRLKDKNFDNTNNALKENILNFYSKANSPVAGKKDSKKQEKINEALKELKQVAAYSAK